MTLISIIIPIYNLENYLTECLESVINQTYKDIEIICVNDSSTDNSLNILNEYAKKDNRIKIINQEHSGPGAARNTGIKNSKGEYILFVDGDDWIENNLAELAYNKISKCNADIVIYAHNNIEKNKSTPHQFALEFLKYYENKEIILEDLVTINHCIWDRMFRKNFLTDNNILFPAEITQNEDGIFNLVCLYHNPTYCCLPFALYNYRTDRKNSIMSKSLHIVNNNILACQYLMSTDIFINGEENFKIIVLNKFLQNILYHIEQKKYESYKLLYILQLNKFIKYLSKHLDIEFLKKTDYLMIKKKYATAKYLTEHLFSVKNVIREEYIKRKCITICGLKFEFTVITDQKEFKKFNQNQINEKSVLVIEANLCHGETMPGYIKMFTELGYDTDVIVTPKAYKENPFCRLDKKYYHNIFQFTPNSIGKILNSPKIKNYKYVFFNSYHLYYDDTPRFSPSPVFKCFSKVISPQNGFIALEHHLDKINTDMMKEKRILQLGNILPDVPFCNSHYYGEVKQHKKNDITQFVVVGEMTPFRKNGNLLIESAEQLINNNIKNFHIDIIGNGTIYIPQNLQNYISVYGRQPFEEMFNFVEKSDFILTLLDPNNETHLRYITEGTSGTFQLCYGFTKPVLLHSKFARTHFFNDKNAILYDEDFTQAMEKCINMSKTEYDKYVEALNRTVKEIENTSIKNLQEVLETNNS